MGGAGGRAGCWPVFGRGEKRGFSCGKDEWVGEGAKRNRVSERYSGATAGAMGHWRGLPVGPSGEDCCIWVSAVPVAGDPAGDRGVLRQENFHS